MSAMTNRDADTRFGPNSYGFVKTLPISLAQAFNGSTGVSLAATTTGTAGNIIEDDGSMAISWNATADSTDLVQFSVTLPEDANFFDGSAAKQSIPDARIGLQMRKVDTTGSAADNATLAVTVKIYAQAPKWTINTGLESGDGYATINATATLAASNFPLTVKANTQTRRWLYVNLSDIFTEAQLKTFVPGTKLDIVIAPSAAIGTGLDFRLSGIQMTYKGSVKTKLRAWEQDLKGGK